MTHHQQLLHCLGEMRCKQRTLGASKRHNKESESRIAILHSTSKWIPRHDDKILALTNTGRHGSCMCYRYASIILSVPVGFTSTRWYRGDSLPRSRIATRICLPASTNWLLPVFCNVNLYCILFFQQFRVHFYCLYKINLGKWWLVNT